MVLARSNWVREGKAVFDGLRSLATYHGDGFLDSRVEPLIGILHETDRDPPCWQVKSLAL